MVRWLCICPGVLPDEEGEDEEFEDDPVDPDTMTYEVGCWAARVPNTGSIKNKCRGVVGLLQRHLCMPCGIRVMAEEAIEALWQAREGALPYVCEH